MKHGAGKLIKKRMRRIAGESNKARLDYYHTRGLNVPSGGQPTKDTSNGYDTSGTESGTNSDEGTDKAV